MFDQTIIQEIKAGGESRLTGIYRAYRDEFIYWAFRHYGCGEEAAKDVYQIAVVILYENILSGKLTELKSSVKTYLFAIGKNKLLEGQAAGRRQQQMQEHFLHEPIAESMDSEREEREETYHTIEEALASLGEPCRTILELYYYRNFSIEQIAKKLGYKGNDSAKTQKYKCLTRLRKLVKDEREEY